MDTRDIQITPVTGIPFISISCLSIHPSVYTRDIQITPITGIPVINIYCLLAYILQSLIENGGNKA